MRTVAKAVAYEHHPEPAVTRRRRGRILAASLALSAFAVTGGSWATQAHAEPIPAPVRPVASPMENSAAMSAFAGEFGTATAVGGFAGTAAGAGTDLVGTLAAAPGTTKWARR